MRLELFLAMPLSLVLVSAACSSSHPECNCPATGIWPLVAVDLPCNTGSLPSMTLTGVCAGTGGSQDGQLVFGANGGGTCHVELTFPNGLTVSNDVEFTAQWLACGSDPHGCGQQVTPVGLPQSSAGPASTLVVTSGCAGADAGQGAADAATE